MANLNRTTNAGDAKLERAKDKALGKHDDKPGVADHVGEAAGGVAGVVAGAAVGSAVGPVGTVIGGILGAMGGWWSGRAIAEAATTITKDDDEFYRRKYESTGRARTRSYDEVRPAYYLGHVASRNPDYRNRSFQDIESELQRGWSSQRNSGTWEDVRGFASEGFSRGRSAIGKATSGVADRVDDMKDRFDGNPASRPGPDRTDRPERQF
ncbi:MAG TPA: hypothetical protein VNO75_00215 [Gemmatimonadaceae bacterium]|nr:hypothetical protein [Gemmatimonadaceae bacterium]